MRCKKRKKKGLSKKDKTYTVYGLWFYKQMYVIILVVLTMGLKSKIVFLELFL